LIIFNSVSLDGYFTGENGDMSWAHNTKPDAEWTAFIGGNASGGGRLLFGRITYEMMASFWPTPQAMKTLPAVAEGMNNFQKLVFSRTLDSASWKNTTLVKSDMVEEVRRLKKEPGEDMAILGSGSIAAQLAQEGLIDEFQIAVVPLAIGKGRTMFDGIRARLPLKRTKTRAFDNGNVLLCYEPIR